MTIKVAMLADYPESGSLIDGGLQAVTSYLVDAMVQLREVELHVISFRPGIDRVKFTKESNFFRYSLPLARFGTLTGFFKDQSTLNSCLKTIRPDIVHSQGGGHHGIIAKRTGLPTVVTIHGIHSQEAAFLPGFKKRLRARLEGWMGEQYYIRRASHTILVSRYVADHYGPVMSGKQHLIPNPVDPRFFNVARRETVTTILFAGRLYELKGVRELLLAASKLQNSDNLRIVLAGSTKDRNYVEKLKADISQLNFSRIVKFRGILPTEKLLDELSRCSCLVLPSFQETAPMVIQEAMAAGVPVIASNICGIPYQVIEGETGFLVPPGDIETLADRLDRLLSNRPMREKFGAAAKKRAEDEYRAATIARKTVDVYREILQGRDSNGKAYS